MACWRWWEHPFTTLSNTKTNAEVWLMCCCYWLQDVPLLVFSVLHFFLALCLCLTALFVFKALKSPNTRLSHEYKIRHTRPMATLATIYGFSALTNLLFRIFLFVRSPEAKDTCHELLVSPDGLWDLTDCRKLTNRGSSGPPWYSWSLISFCLCGHSCGTLKGQWRRVPTRLLPKW